MPYMFGMSYYNPIYYKTQDNRLLNLHALLPEISEHLLVIKGSCPCAVCVLKQVLLIHAKKWNCVTYSSIRGVELSASRLCAIRLHVVVSQRTQIITKHIFD